MPIAILHGQHFLLKDFLLSSSIVARLFLCNKILLVLDKVKLEPGNGSASFRLFVVIL